MLQFQIQDDCKARVYDEKQSNPYVSGHTGQHRAQTLTRDYFDRLYRESRSGDKPSDTGSIEKARQTA